MSNEDAKFTITDHETRSLARLPSRHDDAVDLRKWVSIYAARMQTLEDVVSKIRTSILFDIDTAIGANQDQLGDILGIAREARTDGEYTIILRTQALLVLDERRSQARLMEIVRSLMDVDPGSIKYSQTTPKSYKLIVASPTLGTLVSWIPILRRTRPATYNALLGFYALGHLDFQDVSGTIPVPGSNVSGYGDASGTITNAWGGYSGIIPF